MVQYAIDSNPWSVNCVWSYETSAMTSTPYIVRIWSRLANPPRGLR